MDSLPPKDPPYAYAANDERPRGPREWELCETANSTDWVYMGVSAAVFAGSIYADTTWFKFADAPGVRTIGPATVGLTWGFTLGGGYLAQPRCNGLVPTTPPEGDVRSTWPVALSLAMFAGVTAPMIEFYFTGPIPPEWSVGERRLRLIAGGLGGLGGAFLPYVLPPKTWRAFRELQNIRAGADASSAYVTYRLLF